MKTVQCDIKISMEQVQALETIVLFSHVNTFLHKYFVFYLVV